MQAYVEGDVRSLSAAELLAGQGSSLVVFHPGSRTLYVGLGSDAAPIGVAHCIAYWQAQPQPTTPECATAPPPAPGVASWASHYSGKGPGAAALTDAARVLQLQLPGHGKPAVPPVIRDRLVSGDEDPFAWAEVAAASPELPTPAASAGEAARASEPQQQQQEQQQQQQQQQEQEQQQEQAGNGSKAVAASEALKSTPGPAPERLWHRGRLIGNEALRLPRGAPYTVVWPMAGGRLAGVWGEARLPDHVILDRLEEIWRWALTQLGLTQRRWAALDAVMVVPVGMAAREVRLFADLILTRLGFRSMVAHLEPVAASFGAGASAACVVDVSHLATSITCVEDGAVLVSPGDDDGGQGDDASATRTGAARLAAGGDAVSRTLLALLRAHGAWPEALSPIAEGAVAAMAATGLAGAGALAGCGSGGAGTLTGTGAGARSSGGGVRGGGGAYDLDLVTSLRDARCYCVKASTDPGLVGEALLEDEGSAEVPLRNRGSPTRVFVIPTSPWDCVAPLVLLLPDLDPAAPPRAVPRDGRRRLAAAAGCAGGEELLLEEQAGARPALRPVVPAASNAAAAAGAAAAAAARRISGGDKMEVDGEGGGGGDGAAGDGRPAGGKRPRRGGAPLVEDTPAVERLYLGMQYKSYQQQQDEWQGGKQQGGKQQGAKRKQQQQGGTPGGEGQGTPGGAQQQQQQQQEGGSVDAAEGAGASSLPPLPAYLLGPTEDEETLEKVPLDQAVLRCIDAASAGRIELRQRLLAGILLTGEAGGIRGLPGMVERRVAGLVAAQPLQGVGMAAVQPPMVNVLEPKCDPRHTAWRGAAIITCLDSASSGREGWLQRRQWAGPDAGGGGVVRANAAANRHGRLFAFLKGQQGT